MKKVYLDADVGFDFLLMRKPYFIEAEQIIQLAHQRDIELFVSALSFSHWFYHFRQKHTSALAVSKLIEFRPLLHVANTDERILDQALASEFNDFEDALQHYCALAQRVDVFVTRNVKDYRKARLPVMTPAQFLATI